jgi:hypothetical protein
MNRTARRACRATLCAVAMGFPVLIEAAEIQPQDKFEAAVRNTSSASSVILLTVVDDRTGQARTGCAMAPFLLGAITRETGVPVDKSADMALANPAHEFHFSRPEALANIPFIKAQGACAAVAQGRSVVMRDRSGDFFIKETGEVIPR